jgi:hypothetical protein
MARTDEMRTTQSPDRAVLPGVGSPLRIAPVTNAERMYALDEAWNARDWDTFDTYHDHDDVVVYWPER